MSGPDDVLFDPTPLLEGLVRHRVRFVVIGGFGANLLGSPSVTKDLDLCYARDDDNLERLARALHELHAYLRERGIPEDLPFDPDAATLRAGDHFTFVTDDGPLDLLGTPSGSQGFEQLHRGSVEREWRGLHLKVANVDDLIRMKLAAGRPKDLIEVEVLGALRDVMDEHAAAERTRRRQGRGPESDSTAGSSGAWPSGG